VDEMAPQWWVTYLILALYVCNVLWLVFLGRYWAAGYWLCAAGITVCAMRSVLR